MRAIVTKLCVSRSENAQAVLINRFNICLVGGVGDVVAAASVLVLPEERQKEPFAFTAELCHGNPPRRRFSRAASRESGARPITVSTIPLVGITLFFLLEKWGIWHHCHTEICEVHSSTPVSLGGVIINSTQRNQPIQQIAPGFFGKAPAPD